MKKLLFLFLLIPFINADDMPTIHIIDWDADNKISAYCISGYVFVQYDKTALVQLNKKSKSGLKAAPSAPMTCKEYGN